MRIYISGKITGDADYKKKFSDAQTVLEELGHVVINPAERRAGLDNRAYMLLSVLDIMKCDAVLLLADWKDSCGAKIEKEICDYCNIPVFTMDDIDNLIGSFRKRRVFRK